MRRVFKKKVVAAVFFVTVLFLGAIMQWHWTGKEMVLVVKEQARQGIQIKEFVAKIENVVNEKLVGKSALVEGYGFVQRLLGKQEEHDFEVVQDQEGNLHQMEFATGPKKVVSDAKKVQKFQKKVEAQGTKVLYVMAPDKYIKGHTKLENGLPYDYANETADHFLAAVSARGVDCIDLRSWLPEAIATQDALFYKTDHNWTTQTAFFMFGKLTEALTNQYGMKCSNAKQYTDIKQYNQITYPDLFVGSLGRKTGLLYGGVDDFTVLYPKFETEYTVIRTIGQSTIKSEGTFDEVLLNGAALRTKGNSYGTYLYGEQGLIHIKNHNNTKGPKVLIVKDSMFTPVAAFLSTLCSELYVVDPNYYEGSISEYATAIQGLDYVLLAFAPKSLSAFSN